MSSSLTAHLLKRRRVGLKRAILAISAMTLLLVAGCGSEDSEQAAGDTPSKFAGVVLGKPTERPHFTLTGPDGKPFDFFDETKGELTFLFFGYTNCPDVCPVHMAQLSEILARPGMPTAKVVFVTADPTRDTPEALKKFLGNFNPDFIGLTGTDKEIRAAELAAGVPRHRSTPRTASPTRRADTPCRMRARCWHSPPTTLATPCIRSAPAPLNTQPTSRSSPKSRPRAATRPSVKPPPPNPPSNGAAPSWATSPSPMPERWRSPSRSRIPGTRVTAAYRGARASQQGTPVRCTSP